MKVFPIIIEFCMELAFGIRSIGKQCWSIGYVSLLTLSFIIKIVCSSERHYLFQSSCGKHLDAVKREFARKRAKTITGKRMFYLRHYRNNEDTYLQLIFTCVAKGESRSRSALIPFVCLSGRLSVRPSQNLVNATPLKLLIQLS